MLKILFLIISILLTTVSMFSQFPSKIIVDSKGQLFQSPNTVKGARYKIRVEGTFSIWPEFNDCRGFDGAYVYEAPKEEIDALRWPPEEIEVLGNKIEIFKLPKWVGDPKLYQFPPPNISKPLIELSLEKQKGFRINGEPLNNSGYNPEHYYEIELIGDGMPFGFQIIDSNFNIADGNTIPRYDDNCGSLTINIIENIDTDSLLVAEICNDFFFEGKYHLDANIYFNSKYIDTIENLISLGYKASLSFDNKIFEQYDLNCKYSKVKSEVHFLIDNSGSMLAGETQNDTIQRIDVAKKMIIEIFEILDQNDKVSITAFNQSPQIVSELSNLTPENSAIMKDNIKFIKSGYQTDLLNGLKLLQTQLGEQIDNSKIIIIMSDFSDNINIDFLQNFEELLKQIGIDILLINFAQGGNNTDLVANQMIQSLKNNKKVKVISSKDRNGLFDYLSTKTGTINRDDCCELIFDIDSCYFQKDTIINANLYFLYNDSNYIFNHQIKFDCQQGMIKTINMNQIAFSMNDGEIILEFNSKNNDNILIRISDIMGNFVYESNYKSNIGSNIIKIPTIKYLNGIYLLNIMGSNNFELFKFMKY